MFPAEKTDRPHLKCLIARPLKNGGFGRSRLVRLSTAYLAMKAGWPVVGPDPDDEIAVAKFDREAQPFNRPRVR